MQYQNLLADIRDGAELLQARYDLSAESISVRSGNLGIQTTLGVAITAAFATELIFRGKADELRLLGEIAADALPTSVGLAVDASGPLRAVLRLNGLALGSTFNTIADIAAVAGNAAEQAQDITQLASDLRLHVISEEFELQQQVRELESLVRQEPVLRLELFLLAEAVEQSKADYLGTLARGERLIGELVGFRKAAAAEVQDYRYQDMAFRVFRNDALQKYRAQFDLAARYAYLAATAYDFETNLLASAGSAGRTFLTDLVRQRSLGQVANGTPVAGSRGLADPLARMKQNFDVLKGQLGFNNPQTETNRFSLRGEALRLYEPGDPVDGSAIELSDADWRARLEGFRVANLWDLPEFRRYCRPFAPESAGPQPALVIPFSTTVTFGLNFFGWPLGGGDSAYDPTHFATKVRSVGTWFSGYNGTGLANTPRVYLVPVGADLLRSPAGSSLATREWQVLDQKLPVPFPVGASDLANPAWIPIHDSLNEELGGVRRFSSFRAYHDSGQFNPAETATDSRLIGRSVWNTRWLLIIPGGTLLGNSVEGLDTFIYGHPSPGGGVVDPRGVERDGRGISDVKLFFQTYAYSGNRRAAAVPAQAGSDAEALPRPSQGALLQVLQQLAARSVSDYIPEPDTIVYGQASRNGVPLGSGTVSLVAGAQAEPLATYTLGSVPEFGGLYALRVPLQAFEAPRARAARPGDEARLFIDGSLAAMAILGSRGSARRLDLDTNAIPALQAGGTLVLDGRLSAGQTRQSLVNVLAGGPLRLRFRLADPAQGACAIGLSVDQPAGSGPLTYSLTSEERLVNLPGAPGVWTFTIEATGSCVDQAYLLEVSALSRPVGVGSSFLLIAAALAAGAACLSRRAQRR